MNALIPEFSRRLPVHRGVEPLQSFAYEGVDYETAKKVDFYTRQFIDAASLRSRRPKLAE